MVSVFIMAMVLGLFLANYHGINSQSKLINAAYQAAGDIRMAQNYSMGLKQADSGPAPAGGWGIHFDISSPDSYILFGDDNSSKIYDALEEIETISLPEGIRIDSIDLGSETYADIVFLPPDPAIYINDTGASLAKITIRLTNGNSTKAVYVNSLGLVDVMN